MDYWRRRYLAPALQAGAPIALIGIGDHPEYWVEPELSKLADIWDPARIATQANNYCIYDIEPTLIAKAVERGITAEYCDVTQTPLHKQYRYIFASDVIEHVSDPLAFIQNCKASLLPEGQLILTTPNAAYWRNAVAGFRSEHPEHRCCFANVHLRNLAHMSNLKVTEISSFQAVGRLSALQKVLLPLHLLFAHLGRGNSLVACFERCDIP